MFNINNIPQELQANRQWVGYTQSDIDSGKKIPRQVNGNMAKVNDSTTWATLQELINTNKFVVYGYALTGDYTVIDIDNHPKSVALTMTDEEVAEVERHNKNLTTMVRNFTNMMLKNLDTYIEYSVSGNGVHVFVKTSVSNEYRIAAVDVPLEMFTVNKFVVMTGNLVSTTNVITEDEKAINYINQLQMNYFLKKDTKLRDGETIQPIDKPEYTNEQVIAMTKRDSKFNLLWNNRWEEVTDSIGNMRYSSQHYADAALVEKLVFYTKNCPVQVKELFKMSPTYKAYGTGDKTGKHKFDKDIENDIKSSSSKCTAVYEPKAYIEELKTNDPEKYNELVTKNDEKVFDFTDMQEGDLEMVDNFLECVSTFVPVVSDVEYALEELPSEHTAFKHYMYEYLNEYGNDIPNINYVDGLYKNLGNVHKLTQALKQIIGDDLFYSVTDGVWYQWNGVKYDCIQEERVILNIILKGLVDIKHSIFKLSCEAMLQDNERTERTLEISGRTVTKELSEQDVALLSCNGYWKLMDGNTVISIKNAANIRDNWVGEMRHNDVKEFTETPYINFLNGVLDTRTDELLPHDKKYRMTKVLACNYDVEAKAPSFEKLVNGVMSDDATRSYLLAAFGLGFYKGNTPAKKSFFILKGLKDTGKSTFIELMTKVAGDYGKVISPDLLLKSYGSSNNKAVGPEMFAFKDSCILSSSEFPEGSRLDVSHVKAITGNTALTYRNNFSKTTTTSTFKGCIFIDTNDLPVIPANAEAMWGRVKVFNFVNVIKEKNIALVNACYNEFDGIFQLIYNEMKKLDTNFDFPESQFMLDSKNEYKDEMSHLKRFLAECCIVSDDKKERIKTPILYSTYVNWCKDNQIIAPRKQKFGEEVSDILEKGKSGGTEYYLGVSYNDLGSLYVRMLELTSQEFNKEKNRIIIRTPEKTEYTINKPTYATVKKQLIVDSAEWFSNNITRNDTIESFEPKRYNDYIYSMITNVKVPLLADDFNVVVSTIIYKLSTDNGLTVKDIINEIYK